MMFRKIAALSATAVLALTLVGCQEEKSAKEQLEEWGNLESVSDYRNESYGYLKKLLDGCDPDNPMSLKEGAETSAQLEMLCDDVINESNVPEKCEQAHAYLVESAKETKEASEDLSDAIVALNTNNTIRATNRMSEATEHTTKSTDALNKLSEEAHRLNTSDE